jgi:hypothetical protein
MRIVFTHREKENEAFAAKAADWFKNNPKCYTYAEGDPKPGCLFAIRWNPYTVLIVKLDEEFEPLCYPTVQFFTGDLPPLVGEPVFTS